jgi:hypothetical protein
VLRCAALCCAALRCAVLCCAVLCCAVLCCAVLCCAVLCCAVLCCAVLCGVLPMRRLVRGAGTPRWLHAHQPRMHMRGTHRPLTRTNTHMHQRARRLASATSTTSCWPSWSCSSTTGVTRPGLGAARAGAWQPGCVLRSTRVRRQRLRVLLCRDALFICCMPVWRATQRPSHRQACAVPGH